MAHMTDGRVGCRASLNPVRSGMRLCLLALAMFATACGSESSPTAPDSEAVSVLMASSTPDGMIWDAINEIGDLCSDMGSYLEDLYLSGRIHTFGNDDPSPTSSPSSALAGAVTQNGGQVDIYVNADYASDVDDYIWVLRHEYGHADLWSQGDYDHEESDAEAYEESCSGELD